MRACDACMERYQQQDHVDTLARRQNDFTHPIHHVHYQRRRTASWPIYTVTRKKETTYSWIAYIFIKRYLMLMQRLLQSY